MFKNIFKPKIITLSNGKSIQQKRSSVPIIIIILIISTIICAQMTDFDLGILIDRGDEFFKYFARMIPVTIEYFPKIIDPLLDTIKMSLLGSVLGAVLAIPIAVISAGNIMKNPVILWTARLILSVVRTIPTLVIALVATFVLGLGTLAGTTAITAFTFSYIGKLLYEQIETADMGAFEAMESMGATKTQAFIGAIVPQILPTYIANCLFNFEGNVRYASILGFVGAGGLGLIINEKIDWQEYGSVGMILIVLFIAVAIIEAVSHYIRKKLT